jgi:hypothetical protein
LRESRAGGVEKAGFEREGVLPRYAVFPALGPEPRDVSSYARTFA